MVTVAIVVQPRLGVATLTLQPSENLAVVWIAYHVIVVPLMERILYRALYNKGFQHAFLSQTKGFLERQLVLIFYLCQ
jgi:hypothetical protein